MLTTPFWLTVMVLVREGLFFATITMVALVRVPPEPSLRYIAGSGGTTTMPKAPLVAEDMFTGPSIFTVSTKPSMAESYL